jgi:hypothetical protein
MLEAANYERFILSLRREVCASLQLDPTRVDALQPENVRWDLLAIHLREGVVDFCGDIYYLTENRSHLVEIVQLGWCRTFSSFVQNGSRLRTALDASAELDAPSLLEVLRQDCDQVEIGVLGDTPAASEANRRLSPLLRTSQLVTKGNEKDLFAWLVESSHDRIALCDHVIIRKLQQEDKGAHFVQGANLRFGQPIPVGLVYPREDHSWRRRLVRSLARTLASYAEGGMNLASAWTLISGEFKKNGLEAISLPTLRKSFMMDLSLSEAICWDNKFSQLGIFE